MQILNESEKSEIGKKWEPQNMGMMIIGVLM